MQVVNVPPAADGRNLVPVGPDQTREVRVLVSVPKDRIPETSRDITFRAVDPAGSETAAASEHFIPR